MRILLTGSTGLVGKNILESPRALTHRFFTPTSDELNLLDWERTKEYFSKIKPDIVIHAAGKVGGIQANLADPVGFLVDNLEIGKNVIMAAKLANVPRFLNIGSSCMYPRNFAEPLTEEMILTGELEPTNEGYAISKIVTERLCKYISMSEKFKYKTIIPCNIYGRHDSFAPSKSHLIPAIIYKIYHAMKNHDNVVEIWGDGLVRREFMYAADLADCIFECIDRYELLPATMNVGVGRDYTIKEFYEVAALVLGFNGKFAHDLSKPVGMTRKIVALEKQLDWGWHAQTPLRDGIAMTYDYFLSSIKQ